MNDEVLVKVEGVLKSLKQIAQSQKFYMMHKNKLIYRFTVIPRNFQPCLRPPIGG